MDESFRKTKLIKDVLKNLIRDNNYRYGLIIYLLDSKWDRIVGDKLYEFTMPVRIYKGVLTINCSHQGFMQTLQFYKSDILGRLNEIFKNEIEVTDLRFVYGQIKHHSKAQRKDLERAVEEERQIDCSFDNLKRNFELYFQRCDEKHS